jgi:hypothetical protein
MSEVRHGQGPEGRAPDKQKSGSRPKGRKPGIQARPAPISTKFTGECADLIDCIFDCRDSKQSGKFKTTIGKLATYVGSKYDYGGERRHGSNQDIDVNYINSSQRSSTWVNHWSHKTMGD